MTQASGPTGPGGFDMACFKASRVLNPGRAAGQVLLLDETLSFWGGFDPATGRILDRRHPQAGETVTGRVLVMPGSRGSAGTPAALAESIRAEAGPAAILLTKPDVNIAVGALVADRLYGTETPVLVVADAGTVTLRSGDEVAIEIDGTVTVVAEDA